MGTEWFCSEICIPFEMQSALLTLPVLDLEAVSVSEHMLSILSDEEFWQCSWMDLGSAELSYLHSVCLLRCSVTRALQ